MIKTPENLDRVIAIAGQPNILFGQQTTKEDYSSDATEGQSPVYLLKTED